MTIADLLAASGLDRADAEVLLCAAAGKNRTWLHAHAGDDPGKVAARTFAAYAERRRSGEPVAYILGEKEFYGRLFRVGPGILVPRPCTEDLVDDALAFLDGRREASVRAIDEGIVSRVLPLRDCSEVSTVVDVGTGSGCIAVTIACERPAARIVATDVSQRALETATRNAETHGVRGRIEFLRGSALDPVAGLREPFLAVTNPPYVADRSLLADDVRTSEPAEALMGGGDDGADVVRRIIADATKHPFCAGVVMECLASQASIV